MRKNDVFYDPRRCDLPPSHKLEVGLMRWTLLVIFVILIVLQVQHTGEEKGQGITDINGSEVTIDQ